MTGLQLDCKNDSAVADGNRRYALASSDPLSARAEKSREYCVFPDHSRAVRWIDVSHELLAETPAMKRLLNGAKTAAFCHSAVLITGESGTGKTTIARRIHEWGPWSDRPFLSLDCARLTNDFLVAELLVRGRFDYGGDANNASTGEMGGTLLLEQVEDLPLEAQAKLVSLIDNAAQTSSSSCCYAQPVIRTILTTCEDLLQFRVGKRIHQDLHARLGASSLYIPPLRKNVCQIEKITEHLLSCHRTGPHGDHYRITDEAMHLLCEYDWPGNIRELRQAIGRACSMAPGTTIAASDLQFLPSKQI